MGARWTDDRIKRLRDCARDGLTFSETAVWLGVSRNAVAGKAYREGIVFPDRDQKILTTKRRLARQGET